MSVLSNLVSSYGDDIARAAGNKLDDVARIAANKADDAARIIANKSDDVARIAANKADDASTALGKLLSPEQESYFRGSVIVDNDGNLMPVYHSSPNKFDAFDDARLGQNTNYSNTAFGHFVTPDEEFSRRFRDIDNTGVDGNTMNLYANIQNPITHPYMAANKYSGQKLDKIVEDYYKAIDADDSLQMLKDYAAEDGQSLYEEYMDMTLGEDPFESALEEREALKNRGYDAVEFVEGPKSGLVDGSMDDTPISSYAVFNSNQLKDIANKKPTKNPNVYLGLAGLLGGGTLLGALLGGGDNTQNRA